MITGIGSLLAVKILGPVSAKLFDRQSTKKSTIFRTIERRQRLAIYTNSGEEILQIDDEK